MDVTFVEATNGPRNWGKFAVCRFTNAEWSRLSAVDERPLLRSRGWTRDHVLVIDLQTGEGAIFPSHVHVSDLEKHGVWVCPMFEPALLAICDGKHDPMQTEALLDFPDAPFSFAGYRRNGPERALRDAARDVLSAWDAYVGDEEHEGDDIVDPVALAISELRELL